MFVFRFEYATEDASSIEDAAKEVAQAIENGYDFRRAVADVFDEDNKHVGTIDLEHVSTEESQ